MPVNLGPGFKIAAFVVTLGAAALAADLMWMVPGRIPVQHAQQVAATASATGSDRAPDAVPAQAGSGATRTQ